VYVKILATRFSKIYIIKTKNYMILIAKKNGTYFGIITYICESTDAFYRFKTSLTSSTKAQA